ncbi:MAG: hypothetical protein WCT36_01195 [Candidatus Gracilibacteria bacterium]|jgi:hypothetical protein
MNKNKYIYIIFITVILLTIDCQKNLTESSAISILQTAYPEFNTYPNDNLPPQSIRTEQDTNGWHIAFVQEGSGVPIIGAKCYFVNNDESIQTIGEFTPSTDDMDFSIKTCKK